LHLGRALEEALGVPADRSQDRQHQEGVDRNEDRIEPVPLDPDQEVLHRQRHEEGERDRMVIAAPRVGQAHELAQGVERDQIEQHDHAALAEGEGDADHRDHHPPRVDARVQVVDHRMRLALRHAPLEQRADGRGEDQHAGDAAEERERGLAGGRNVHDGEISSARSYSGRRSSIAARARAMNAFLSSPSIRLIGAP
jgi:hypothetical protein